MLNSRSIFITAGILGALAVVFGAFGAHALKETLSPKMFNAFETGTRYQAWHATTLLVLGLVSMFSVDKSWRVSATFISVGTVLFSFSLYGLALGGPSWLGPVTPLGGLLMIIGWITLTVAACNLRISK